MPMLVSTFVFLPLATVVLKAPELAEFYRKPEHYARMQLGPAAWDSLERLGLMNRVIFEFPGNGELQEQKRLKYTSNLWTIAQGHIFTSQGGDTVRYEGQGTELPLELSEHPLWRVVAPTFVANYAGVH